MPLPTTLITDAAEPFRHLLRPSTLFGALWRDRHVIRQLGRRQVQARHRGSVLGMAWTLLHPLLLLAVYTIVFRFVFQVGKDRPDGAFGQALLIFSGMVPFAVFGDTLTRAPLAITSRPNYVKKIVFPLTALPAAELHASTVLGGFSLVVLLTATLLGGGGVPVTALALPLLVPPLLLLSLGAAWAVAALGVYVRDVASSIGIAMTMLFFLTPVFWQVADWPPHLQPYVLLNPLAVLIEAGRDCLLRGSWPAPLPLLVVTCVSLVVAQLGFAWFQHARRGFADVL